jgi:heme/copper-type cytochrome/quinol oxidase subunit 1
LSSIVRGFLALFCLENSDIYSAAVTGHAVGFVFFTLPVLLVGIYCILRWALLPAGSFSGTSLHRQLSIDHILLAGLLLCFSTTSVATGWTFYPPLLSIIGNQDKTCLILITVVVVTSAFLMAVSASLTGRILPLGVVQNTLFAGHIFAVFVIPLLLIALTILVVDQIGGLAVLDYPLGSPLIYETLFWVFGHPEVYLLILPFIGLLFFARQFSFSSTAGRSVRGFRELSGPITRIAFISFFVWGHHLFATSMTPAFKVFFIFASLYIMIPMFDIIRRTFYRRSYVYSKARPLSRIAALLRLFAVGGFFVGGLLS